MQKHSRVLTTPSTPDGQVAGPSLPEEVEELHSSESAASEPNYWLVQLLFVFLLYPVLLLPYHFIVPTLPAPLGIKSMLP